MPPARNLLCEGVLEVFIDVSRWITYNELILCFLRYCGVRIQNAGSLVIGQFGTTNAQSISQTTFKFMLYYRKLFIWGTSTARNN
jgi:hypothetical protein